MKSMELLLVVSDLILVWACNWAESLLTVVPLRKFLLIIVVEQRGFLWCATTYTVIENINLFGSYCQFVCFFWNSFSSHWRIFSLIWKYNHCRWRTANFYLCSALMVIEHWGFFNVPHLLWHGASVYNGNLRPVTLKPRAECLAVELSLSALT